MHKHATKPELAKYTWKQVLLFAKSPFIVAYRHLQKKGKTYTFQVWLKEKDPDYFWIGVFNGRTEPNSSYGNENDWNVDDGSLEDAMDQANKWWTAGNA